MKEDLDMKIKDSSIYFVIIESFIIAGITGIYTKNLLWGTVAFFVLVIAYEIPVLGNILSITSAMIETYAIYEFGLKFLPTPINAFITLITVYLLMIVHRILGVMSKNNNSKEAFRYSLIISECLMLSIAVWYYQKSIPVACVVFAALTVMVFTPTLRIIGRLGLTFGTSFLVWEVTHKHMEMKYSVLITALVFIYIGFHHAIFYTKNTKLKKHHKKVQNTTKNAANMEEDYYKQSYYLNTHTNYEDVLNDEGKYGEYLIYKSLRHHEKQGAKFLFNCFLNREDNSTTEIDVMLICQGGIFVFESKNYSGWIFGNENSLNWTQILPMRTGQSKKTQFYNPVKQNNTHIRYLKKLIGSNIPIYSIIVFSDKCTLKDIKAGSENIYVIQCGELKSIVSTIIRRTKYKLDAALISELYNKLYPFTQVSNKVKKKHIENIEKNIVPLSKEHALKQPKKEGLKLLICPQCGSQLVLRITKRGDDIGKSFYGCSAFPKCRYTREIDKKKIKSIK